MQLILLLILLTCKSTVFIINQGYMKFYCSCKIYDSYVDDDVDFNLYTMLLSIIYYYYCFYF